MVERRITGFRQDPEQHWIAELECGHSQHVRHTPPWEVRPWVLTLEGRAGRLGTLLPCRQCDDPQQDAPAGAIMDETRIREFLESFGKALTSGDVEGIAKCWEVPALVLSDEGSVAVSAVSQVATFFAGAVEWYRSEGLVATRPVLERVERLSEKLSAVDVRWLAFDVEGKEKAAEYSHYILHLGEDGLPYIRLALTRTADAS